MIKLKQKHDNTNRNYFLFIMYYNLSSQKLKKKRQTNVIILCVH